MKSVDTQKIAKPEGPWLPISGAFTHLTLLLSERNDLTVSIAPEAGWGSPAAMLPPAASIEINAAFWPDNFDPAKADPRDFEDWANYAAVMGLLAHEVSHGDFSDWVYQVKKAHTLGTRKLDDDQMNAFGAAELLEESRIEHRHIMERPQDTPWLQASASTISLAEALEKKDELTTLQAASRVAAIVLARADGGSLLPSPELGNVRTQVTLALGGGDPVKGKALLGKLQEIWKQFHNTPDDDTDEFLRLGKEWFGLTQDNGQDGSQDDAQPGDGRGISQELSDALNELGKAALDEASGSGALDKLLKKLDEAAKNRKSESAQKAKAKEDAKEVFHSGNFDGGVPAGIYLTFTGYRQPTVAERKRARRTADAILKAYIRESAMTKTTSQRPPGRLRPSVAIQGQAQRAQGMYPTVEPFTRKEYRRAQSPPLKVGIVVDTSSSQDDAAGASASGAYSLAAATRIIPDGSVAMVTFGDKVQKIFGPWEKPKGVPKLDADGGTGYFQQALRALEGELHLMRGGAARLLVIITDGALNPDEFAGRDELLKRYLNAGVRILWVNTGMKQRYHVPSKVGLNGHPAYATSRLDATWFIPEIVHPLYRVANPYEDSNLIPELITAEAVRALEQTR